MSKDISNKEQMAIVLRFVDDNGFVQERFFELVYVKDTCALTLKTEISNVLARFDLDIMNMRGQGYDGASNMSGVTKGLQAMFKSDCQFAYYVHYFAHRLQLALVVTAEKKSCVWLFFSKLTCIVNLVGASSKWNTELHGFQKIIVQEEICSGERETGKGANQMGNLIRAGSTRWSSNFDSICSLIDMYGATIQVFEAMVNSKGTSNKLRGQASGSLIALMSFEFVFLLFLMHKIMGISNILCRALQQKDLDILNAMTLVKTTKLQLLELKDEKAFQFLLEQTMRHCAKYDIEVPEMTSSYNGAIRRVRQQQNNITCVDYYRDKNYNFVNYDEKVMDGFYDVYSIGSSPGCRKKIPMLFDLQAISVSDNVDYEVTLVNRTIHPLLHQLEERPNQISM